jgi:NitT/TauT family transport system substrate-binding protein
MVVKKIQASAQISTAIFAAILALNFTSQAQAETAVTVRMDTFFYGAHVPVLLGIVDGIYKKHGLDVTAVPGRGSANTIQTVAAGTDQFGFADGGTLVKFAAQGLKAKQIVGMLETTPAIILTMPESGITTAKDLSGKTGGFGIGSAPEQLFGAFAKGSSLDPDSVKRVSVDLPTRDSLFMQKKIDFSFGYTVTQLPLMEEKCSCKLNVLPYAAAGITAVSNGITVGDDYAARNPEIVRGFAQATVEAIEAAVKNPQHAVDAFFEYARDSRLSRPVVTAQWTEAIKLLHTAATKDEPYGVTSPADWQKTIDVLVEYADLPKGAVMPGSVATNEYLAADDKK